MTHTPTGPLVFPGVYQLEQGASITTEEWEAISGIELWLAQQHHD
ncbi:hypothetical protein [Pantoea agglomerans]|uniref:Uncharacterized protein n=1 Tax=Enterobacter agglomerans TaxID=549 RepID=A0AAN2FIB8_ENTAG|nr:hypothetical protein [Pantoea agglomerans]CAH6383056.1 hypothetical protein DAPPPG734_25205 [Pantoea agglomerans]